jgi:hypothetical protein
MVSENEIQKIMEKHLEAIDLTLKQMIEAAFEHESIHIFRESIRQFRALMFFCMDKIRSSDYRMVESVSKKYFNMTSLIREIDEFERGYAAFMNLETLEKLALIKEPLLERMKVEFEETNGFRFQHIKVHMKPIKSRTKIEPCFNKRQCDLISTFLEKEGGQFFEEKFIHAKRILAKKLIYVHNILMADEPSLLVINMELEAFQDIAKQLHDVCVNLRFVGQYQLNDQALITKLVHDHMAFTALAEAQYEKTSEVMESFLNVNGVNRR